MNDSIGHSMAILAGASDWPKFDKKLEKSGGFQRSADGIREYFLSSDGLNLPQDRFLDLFDSSLTPSELDEEIATFIGKYSDVTKNLIFYFVGHGAFSGDQQYCLLIKSSRSDNLSISSLKVADLATTICMHARNLRRILFFDSCFAANAVGHFMSTGEEELIRMSIAETFPDQGSAVLCAAAHNRVAKLLPDESGTMFTSSLLEVLSAGRPGGANYLSLREVEEELYEYIFTKHLEESVKPELHSPNQQDGDVSSMPMFPNSANRPRQEPSRMTNHSELTETKEIQFELEIRRGLASDDAAFLSLELLASNTFREIDYNESDIYGFSMRRKTVGGVLKKIAKLRVEEGLELDNYADVTNAINDFVGIRVLLFCTSRLVVLNNLLMSYKRLRPIRITVHKQEGENTQLVSELSKSCPIPIETPPSRTGYFGVHYVFEIDPMDEVYLESSITPFPKFELQVRTVLQHAWSEIEHRLVYKSGEDDSQQLSSQFQNLSVMLQACDRILDSLAYYEKFAPTLKETSDFPDRFAELMTTVTTMKAELLGDSDVRADLTRTGKNYAVAQKNLFEVYPKEIDSLIRELDPESAVVALELAEVCLKFGHYDTAEALYLSALNFTVRNGWVFLRLAETYEGKRGTNRSLVNPKDILSNLYLLRDHLSERHESDSQDDDLCRSAAILAWRNEDFELAYWLGEKAISLIDASDLRNSAIDRINFIYYCIDYWTHEDKQLQKKESRDKFHGLQNNLEEAIEAMHRLEEKEIPPSIYDSLGWGYYYLAKVEFVADNLKAAAGFIKLADDYMQMCENAAMLAGASRDVWRDHREAIRILMGQLFRVLA